MVVCLQLWNWTISVRGFLCVASACWALRQKSKFSNPIPRRLQSCQPGSICLGRFHHHVLLESTKQGGRCGKCLALYSCLEYASYVINKAKHFSCLMKNMERGCVKMFALFLDPKILKGVPHTQQGELQGPTFNQPWQGLGIT